MLRILLRTTSLMNVTSFLLPRIRERFFIVSSCIPHITMESNFQDIVWCVAELNSLFSLVSKQGNQNINEPTTVAFTVTHLCQSCGERWIPKSESQWSRTTVRPLIINIIQLLIKQYDINHTDIAFDARFLGQAPEVHQSALVNDL